jgi:hypothetical protein
MTNYRELPTELKESIAKHQLWLDGNTKGEKADFNGYSLENLDLSGLNLQKINFGNAKLYGCNCIKTNFSGSNFSCAVLENNNFNRANFTEANLTLVNRNIETREEIPVNDFQKANFKNTNFDGSYLGNSDFTYANWENTYVTEATLRGKILIDEHQNLRPYPEPKDLLKDTSSQDIFNSFAQKSIVQNNGIWPGNAKIIEDILQYGYTESQAKDIIANSPEQTETGHKSVRDLLKMVNNELNSVVDNINKNAQIMIDAGLPELVRNHIEAWHDEDGKPHYDYDESNLWNIVSHKYLEKYDIPYQTLWKKYDAMDISHKENLEEFNKIEKPSKLNIVGRYLYHSKEKELKIEEISVKNALEEFQVSEDKLEEKLMNLNAVDDKDVYVLYDKMQAAMGAYSSLNQFELGPLEEMKEALENVRDKEIYIKGHYKDIDSVIKHKYSIKEQLITANLKKEEKPQIRGKKHENGKEHKNIYSR